MWGCYAAWMLSFLFPGALAPSVPQRVEWLIMACFCALVELVNRRGAR